jgi:hypothetical protein
LPKSVKRSVGCQVIKTVTVRCETGCGNAPLNKIGYIT